MNDIYIYGASGHGKVVLDAALKQGKNVIAFIDDNKDINNFAGLPVLSELPKGSSYIIAIGNNEIRKNIESKYSSNKLLTVIHPNSTIHNSSTIGRGTLLGVNSVVNPDVIIGNNCIINTSAVIEHDCVIDNFVHISPNSTLCGGVTVGKGTHIGASAVIIPGVSIGEWCTIGAGSVIIKNIPNGATVVGNPGIIIKHK